MHGSKRSRLGRLIVVLLVLLVVSVIFGVSLGSTTTPPSVVVKVLLSHIPGLSSWFSAPETAADASNYKIRLPRVI